MYIEIDGNNLNTYHIKKFSIKLFKDNPYDLPELKFVSDIKEYNILIKSFDEAKKVIEGSGLYIIVDKESNSFYDYYIYIKRDSIISYSKNKLGYVDYLTTFSDSLYRSSVLYEEFELNIENKNMEEL